MKQFKIIVTEYTTYEKVITARSLKSLQNKLNNQDYDFIEVNHSDIVDSEIENIYVEEII
jgi:hypothetical protein